MDKSYRMLKLELKQKEQQLAQLQKEYDSIINSKLWKTAGWLHNSVEKKQSEDNIPQPDPVYRVPADALIDVLKNYDVIAFDLFDTLVLQNIRNHNDIYDIVALKSGFESFAELRMRAQNQMEEEYASKTEEYNISHIYNLLSQWLAIDSDKVMNIELSTETALSVENSYMKKVYERLMSQGKEIVVMADSYLPYTVIENILSSCGYTGYSHLVVSNRDNCSKAKGTMYDYVDAIYPGKSKISVGDEYINDIVNAESHGWAAVCYFPCRDISAYRFTGTHSPAGDVWSGIVTNKMFASLDILSSGYKHGYVYGGILTAGYCKWLEKFALANNADKILFLARDAKIYSEIFGTHINTISHDYMLVSRFAMWQIVFDIHTEEYIRFFFYNRALAANTTINASFAETGMDFLIDKIEEAELNGDELITLSNYPSIRRLIYANKELISDKFAPYRKAAEIYFNECFGDAKKIILSDVGWSGQIVLHMRHFVKEVMKRDDIEITGAFMAVNERKDVNKCVNNGILQSYLYNYGQNRDMNVLMENNIGNTALMCLEAMYSASSPTLMSYHLTENGQCDFVFGEETANTHVITDVQQGIKDFVYDWFATVDKLDMDIQITAADGFSPYEDVAFDWQYLVKVFGQFAEYTDSLPRFGKSRMYTTIEEIMKQRGLI